MHSPLPFDVPPAYSSARDASIAQFTSMICEQLQVTRQRLQVNGRYTVTPSNLKIADEDTLHFWQVAGLEQLLAAVCNSMVLHSRADASSARLVIADLLEDWAAEFRGPERSADEFKGPCQPGLHTGMTSLLGAGLMAQARRASPEHKDTLGSRTLEARLCEQSVRRLDSLPDTLREWRELLTEVLHPFSTTSQLAFESAVLRAVDGGSTLPSPSLDLSVQPAASLCAATDEIEDLLSAGFGDWKGWLQNLQGDGGPESYHLRVTLANELRNLQQGNSFSEDTTSIEDSRAR